MRIMELNCTKSATERQREKVKKRGIFTTKKWRARRCGRAKREIDDGRVTKDNFTELLHYFFVFGVQFRQTDRYWMTILAIRDRDWSMRWDVESNGWIRNSLCNRLIACYFCVWLAWWVLPHTFKQHAGVKKRIKMSSGRFFDVTSGRIGVQYC